MNKVDQLATWCRPYIEDNFILFRHAYKSEGKWYDLKVLQKEGDQIVLPNGRYVEMRLIEIQKIALEKIFPHLAAPTTQTVSYSSLPQESCAVDGASVDGEVLEGMREIDQALNGELGGVSLAGRSLTVQLRRFNRPPPPKEAEAEEIPNSPPVWNNADYLGTIDQQAQSDRFDPAISYVQFTEQSRSKPATAIYQAYLKLVQDPSHADCDAKRMKRWLESLRDAAAAYLKNHPLIRAHYNRDPKGAADFDAYCKKQAAQDLIHFIFVENLSPQNLITSLS